MIHNAATIKKSFADSMPKSHISSVLKALEESCKRITARVSEDVRVTLEQAAELVGSTVNQFMVQAAYQEAQRLIERESLIHLSQHDARKVFSLLEHPPKPNKQLRKAIAAFKGSLRA